MYIIQNGTLVSSEKTWQADLALEDGRIAAVAPAIPAAPGDQCLDAAGCLVFPGFIDPHTHLDMDNGVTVTAGDFPSGTLAAVCGGTTTILDFATQDRGGTLAQALERWHAKADGRSSCNYGFHMAVTDWNESTRRELRDMIAAGVTSLKVYLAYDALRVDDGALLDIFQECRALGLQIGCHCENGDIVNLLQRRELAKGNRGPAGHPASRPPAAEAEAVARCCRIAAMADCPVIIVHLSTEAGLEAPNYARNIYDPPMWAETCPQYLFLNESRYGIPGFEGAKYVMSPPLRTDEDRWEIGRALLNNEIQTLGSDHCSYNFAGQKELGREDFTKIPNGIPGLEHRPALLFSEYTGGAGLTPEQMCRILSENPARLYGMYPQKGVLAVGSDADVTVWDPEAVWTITAAAQHHKVDYTPYEGMTVTGRAKAVFVNGVLAARDGEPVQTGLGRYVFRRTLDEKDKRDLGYPINVLEFTTTI